MLEDGAEELLDSPNMQPYCRYLEALVLGADVNRAIEEIADLPLERRYVWRAFYTQFQVGNIASSLLEAADILLRTA